jgi:hypothetical protein
MSKYLTFFLALFIVQFSFATNENYFIQNKGQWHESVLYKAEFFGQNVYLEKNGFTYDLYKGVPHSHTEPEQSLSVPLNRHAIKIDFVGSSGEASCHHKYPTSHYTNYFLGNDPMKWASEVYGYNQIDYNSLYEGIDMSVYFPTDDLNDRNAFKYDLVVQKGFSPNLIQIAISGADEIYLNKGELHIRNTVNDIIESKPVAYQVINGKRVLVDCKFKLEENILGFEFPNGYNLKHKLIIDPTVCFSTYAGSTADNFGFTATGDAMGYMYVAGIAFAGGVYPTTIGAYQPSFNGGPTATTIDIAISKFDSTGSNLIYSTYLGGTGSETPHSLVVNNNYELLVLGTSGSADFPTSANAYAIGFSGGLQIAPPSSGVSYTSGSDIVVSKFNINGTQLLASTYMGGSDNDGLNSAPNLTYCYGDAFQGEIALDSTGDVFVVSSTNSTDFPVTAGALQTVAQGTQEAVVFKMSYDLSQLIWSTYLGGSGDDTGFSIELWNSNVYVCGATTGGSFPTTAGALNVTYSGGGSDGFVVNLNSSGSVLQASTFLGGTGEDLSYFVRTDAQDSVYVFGLSTSNYPVTSGTYNNPNSGQFIHKMDNMFSGTGFSSVFGGGTGEVDISPTSFQVNYTGELYLSGWGGSLNGLYLANSSTTLGLPLTADAFQSSTDGSDFYFAAFSPGMTNLDHATFFGGNVSREHMDGGTSYISKFGILYQAMCAGCGGNSDLYTSPGAWSQTNNSGNCNLAAVRYDLGNSSCYLAPDIVGIGIDENGPVSPVLVYPNPFVNGATVKIHDQDNGPYQLLLYDTFGRQVRAYDNIQSEVHISSENLGAGLYFLNIRSMYGNKFFWNESIIISKE